VRVVVADDSLLFREGLSRLLTENGFDVVATTADAPTLHAQVARQGPDVAIVDIRMPPTQTTEGLDAAKSIRATRTNVGVLVLSQHVETHHALELLAEPGGVGYLLKDRVSNLRDFCDAVQRVGSGGTAIDQELVSRLLRQRREHDRLNDLTDRERDVLALMAEGRSNQGIAERLYLAPKTVETHIHRIFSKLDLSHNETGHRRVLAVIAYLNGNTSPP
jgi:DNA-binding NarL/FixJ family response regulator